MGRRAGALVRSLSSLDRTAVTRGALVDLGVLLPLVLVYIGFRAAGYGSAGTAVVIAATVLAPLAGGFTAGRLRMNAPLTNGAAAATVAVVAYVIFRVADSRLRATALHPASVVVFVMLSVTLGMLGGFAGFRSARRPQ